MTIVRGRIATILIFILITLLLAACDTIYAPADNPIGTPQPVYNSAQATLDYGQNQLNDLSNQATMVALNMAQDANAAEQATADYYQRQLMELAIQGTAVSQNLTQAAATQQSIIEQTQRAHDIAATQTEYAHVILNVHTAETAQVVAALTSISQTATPLAETQAAILFQQRKYERQSFWGEIVTPIKIVLVTFIILLLILGGVLAFRRFMPVLEFRLLNPNQKGILIPLLLKRGIILDTGSSHLRLDRPTLNDPDQSQLAGEQTQLVEMIDSFEPSIINWITEAEQKLRIYGRIPE